MADRVVRAIRRKGLTVNTYNIFTHLLSDVALFTVVNYTDEQLLIKGYPATWLLDFKQLIGTR